MSFLHVQHIFANSFNFLVTQWLLVTVFHSTCIFCIYGMALYLPTLQFCVWSMWRPLVSVITTLYYVATIIFHLSCVVSRAFPVLCRYSKFGHHSRPLGYLCGKFRFCWSLHCWASPSRKIAYSITHSLTHRLIWCTGNRSPKLALGNNWNQSKNLWRQLTTTIENSKKTITDPSTMTIENWQRARFMDVLCSQLRWLILSAQRSAETHSGIVTWRPFTRPSLRIEPPATSTSLSPVMHVPAQILQLSPNTHIIKTAFQLMMDQMQMCVELCLYDLFCSFDLDQGVKYSTEASSSINTGVETTRSHLAH